jgi:hypothetical protein
MPDPEEGSAGFPAHWFFDRRGYFCSVVHPPGYLPQAQKILPTTNGKEKPTAKAYENDTATHFRSHHFSPQATRSTRRPPTPLVMK